MIRLTRPEFEQLRSGKKLEVPCPRKQRAGRAYKAVVLAVADDQGNELHARVLRTVTIIEKPDDLTAIIAWSDQTDTPRFLHRDSSRGYTREPYQALHDEAESVSAETLEQFAKAAEDLNEIRRSIRIGESAAARERIDLHERLRTLEHLRGTADITRELRAIRQRIERAENRAA